MLKANMAAVDALTAPEIIGAAAERFRRAPIHGVVAALSRIQSARASVSAITESASSDVDRRDKRKPSWHPHT
jgi:hypothetical protein